MFFRKLNWNIVSWFKTVSTISFIVIGLGLGSMVYHGFDGGQGFQASHMLRLGLSFTGGTEVAIAYEKPQTIDSVRAALAPLNLADERLTTKGSGGNQFVLDTQTSFANDAPTLYTALGTAGTLDRNSVSVSAIGPSLGGEYLRNALLALIIALGIQFLYIAFRFGWNYIFGLVTIIALLRDAAMMIGIYALVGKPADDAFLAAVLTVIGYSVMDTIVILDRIRENTKLMAGQPYDVIVNESIKQTMTRSFNTLATVVITLVALLVLGGASLQNFGFALLVGICSGGYHSIFFSAPLVLVYRKRQLEAAARRRTEAAALPHGTSTRGRTDAPATSNGMAREDIVAARRERRAKTKTVQSPSNATPNRYKRKRVAGDTIVEDQETYDQAEAHEEVDPLDAQTSGMHDEAMEQGHETVSLNLEGFDTHPTEHARYGEEHGLEQPEEQHEPHE